MDVEFEPTPVNAPPGQVTNVNATAGSESASLTWKAPSGGGPVTKYTITPYKGSEAQTATSITGSPPATGTTITGLTNGTAYTFTVQASNQNGNGTVSEHSNAVTPSAPTVPSAPTAVSASAGAASATVTWTAPGNGGSPITKYTITPYKGSEAQTATSITGSPPATGTTITGLTNGTAYTFTVTATNSVGTGAASEHSNAVTPSASSAPDTIFGTSTPATTDSGDTAAVELGVAFSSEVSGSVTGIRFYKASTNTGTHIGSLWSASGTLLGSATFTNETASGWQQASFSSPIQITANTTYVAAYLAPKGHYSDTSSGLATTREQPASERTRQFRLRQRQRPLRLQQLKHLPHQQLQIHQLLGGRGI